MSFREEGIFHNRGRQERASTHFRLDIANPLLSSDFCFGRFGLGSADLCLPLAITTFGDYHHDHLFIINNKSCPR